MSNEHLRLPPRPPGLCIGLFGGSFNPAHDGHRLASLTALRRLQLDRVWWLVTPGNPLKDNAELPPLAERVRQARGVAGDARIQVTGIEATLRTRYTADTLAKLVQRYPKRRFIWVMGADNLAQFHRWRDWRRIARTVPIAVIARPGYDGAAHAAPAMGWLRRFQRPARQARNWTEWSVPALVLLRFRPDATSATRLRAADPSWYRRFSGNRSSGAAAKPFAQE